MALADTCDPRVERSYGQLVDALRLLLQTRDPREISVSALCAAAGVSRPTFYQHFSSVDEVAVVGVQRRIAELSADLPAGPDPVARLLVRWLEALDAERALWRRTIGSAFASCRESIETWLAGQIVEQLAERGTAASVTAVRYAAAGFLGVTRAWLLEDDGPDRLTPEQLAAELSGLSARVISATAS